jgi:hypothetical protein
LNKAGQVRSHGYPGDFLDGIGVAYFFAGALSKRILGGFQENFGNTVNGLIF